MLSDRKGQGSLSSNLVQMTKGDEVDVVTAQKEQALNMRLDERNILFLKKVAEAKQKILDGTFGECEECGDDISQKRLLARPTASLCINCQEDKEKEEFGTFKKRRDLSTKKFREESEDDHIVRKQKFTSVSDIAFESVVDL